MKASTPRRSDLQISLEAFVVYVSFLTTHAWHFHTFSKYLKSFKSPHSEPKSPWLVFCWTFLQPEAFEAWICNPKHPFEDKKNTCNALQHSARYDAPARGQCQCKRHSPVPPKEWAATWGKSRRIFAVKMSCWWSDRNSWDMWRYMEILILAPLANESRWTQCLTYAGWICSATKLRGGRFTTADFTLIWLLSKTKMIPRMNSIDQHGHWDVCFMLSYRLPVGLRERAMTIRTCPAKHFLHLALASGSTNDSKNAQLCHALKWSLHQT